MLLVIGFLFVNVVGLRTMLTKLVELLDQSKMGHTQRIRPIPSLSWTLSFPSPPFFSCVSVSPFPLFLLVSHSHRNGFQHCIPNSPHRIAIFIDSTHQPHLAL